MLQFMVLERVGHDLATEQKQRDPYILQLEGKSGKKKEQGLIFSVKELQRRPDSQSWYVSHAKDRV